MALYLASNLKYLRKRKRLTQDDLSKLLEIKRSTLNGYEQNISRPGIEGLILLSDFFGISIDSLIRIDLQSLSESSFQHLEKGNDAYIRGTNLRVLSTTINSKNQENIEMVPEKAKAGYTSGFADPDFIAELPSYQLPFLSKNKKYRSFQITGDSMLPVPDGAWVSGEFVQDWTSLKKGTACIVLTLHDGIVFKILYPEQDELTGFTAVSLNPAYKPYSIRIQDIREIWKFSHLITTKIPDSNPEDSSLKNVLSELEKTLHQLKNNYR